MGNKKIKNSILGSVNNVGSIVIGDQVHYHVSKDDVKESKVMSKDIMDKTQENESIGEVFIMYSWDSEEHKVRVMSLWKTLRDNGFHAVFDRHISQENTAADFNEMMHKAITDYNKIIIVLSEGYKNKANNFKGGVGNEYKMVIKDFDDHPRKYILLSFDEISDTIFTPFLKGKEVVQISNQDDLERLFGKLMDVPEFEIPEVAASKPVINPQKIAPLFKSNGLKIEAIYPKSSNGSRMQASKYIYHEQTIAVRIKNESSNTVNEFKIKINLPKSLMKYDHDAEIKEETRVITINSSEKVYPGETKEIICANLYIHYVNAENAFESNLQISVYSELGKIECEYPISKLLIEYTSGEHQPILFSDFHDKYADIK